MESPFLPKAHRSTLSPRKESRGSLPVLIQRSWGRWSRTVLRVRQVTFPSSSDVNGFDLLREGADVLERGLGALENRASAGGIVLREQHEESEKRQHGVPPERAVP